MTSWLDKLQFRSDPVESAGASLRSLSERGIEIPLRISIPIVAAENAEKLARASAETQSEFWSAYGALNAKIKSPEDAKNYYRRFFYGILTALLLLQLYFSAFAAVQKGLVDLNKEIEAAQLNAAAVTVAGAAGVVAPDKAKELVAKRNTYLQVADYLMGVPRKMVGFFSFIGLDAGSRAIPQKPEVLAQVQLELATSFVGGFLLPVLYGMLGAIAFVLRRLSDDTAPGEAVRALKRKYSLRVPIGALSGLAAGWLLQSSTGSLTASLSPFALAFVAGYSADLVFTAMDRIVAAFSATPTPKPEPPSPSHAPGPGIERWPEGQGTDEQPDAGNRAGARPNDAVSPSSRAQANLDV